MKILAIVYLTILAIEYVLTKHEALKDGMSTFDWLIKTACWEQESKTFQMVGLAIIISPLGQALMFGVVMFELWQIMQAKKGA